MKNVLVWFGLSDLRLHDNYALKIACRRAKAMGGSIFPFFCFDHRQFASASDLCGFFTAHPRRAIFIMECIDDLRKNLAKHDQHLWVRHGCTENILPKLAQELDCCEVYTHAVYSPDDLVVRESLENQLRKCGKTKIQFVWGSTLVHIDDLEMPIDQFPLEFGKYHDAFHRMRIRETYAFDCRKHGNFPPQSRDNSQPPIGAIPSLTDLGYKEQSVIDDPRGVLKFDGGETAGCARVARFFDSKIIDMYNPGFAEKERARLFKNQSSHLSPWISHGCVSVRRIYELIREYSLNRRGTKDWECKSFLMFLIRRDYWHFLARRLGSSLRAPEGPTPKSCSVNPPKEGWRMDPLLITRWCSGCTGTPFVDAAMRELTLTGYTSAQCRRALLWFLTRGLQQDWRVAAEWFQRSLLDFDPHICWGNCMYYSGLMFDIGSRMPLDTAEHQQLQFDGSGVFTRLWVPELHNVPTHFLHRPQAMTKRMQEMHSARVGVDYPLPIKLWFDAEKDVSFVNNLPSYINMKNEHLLGEGQKFGLGKFPSNKVFMKLSQ